MAVALGRRLRRRMPRGGPAEPLGHTRRTIESTGGARSSAPCRSWCGDTGCGVDLLAADELNLEEVRRSRKNKAHVGLSLQLPRRRQKHLPRLGGGL